MVEAYLNGIFPRSEKALEAGSNLLKGRETKEQLFRLLEEETLELIKLQQDLNLDYVTDGQLLWQDFLRPIVASLGLHGKSSNADENPVTRQVYTNTFYRKPVVSDKINFHKNLVDERFLAYVKKEKRKIILPSPFAFAYLSDGIHKNEDGTIKKDTFMEVLLNFAEILNHEAKRLSNEVSFIQFNDPCLAYSAEAKILWGSIKDSLSIATENISATTSLHLYNGDASLLLPGLLDLPVDRIGIDPYTTDLRQFFGTSPRFLEIGVINSKNSLVEGTGTIVTFANQVIEKIKPNGLALVPNRPLELVPRSVAIKKIENLAKAAHSLNSK